jgi:hypothetical protein
MTFKGQVLRFWRMVSWHIQVQNEVSFVGWIFRSENEALASRIMLFSQLSLEFIKI